MSTMFNLSRNQKALALNLAILLEGGCVPADYVAKLFKQDPILSNKIIQFWLSYNHTTRRALDMVTSETVRQHFENCLELNSQGHHQLED